MLKDIKKKKNIFIANALSNYHLEIFKVNFNVKINKKRRLAYH